MNSLNIESPRCLSDKDNIPLNINDKEKNKLIDLSTNASNKMIPNLSNPTNLTNPLIIVRSKKSYNDDLNENNMLSNKEYKINKLNEYNKLIFSLNNKKIYSSKSELDLLNEGIKGQIKINTNKKKRLLKPIESKRTLKEIDSRNSLLFANIPQKSINYSKNEVNYNQILNKNSDNKINEKKNKKTEKNKEKGVELDSIWEKLKNSKILSPKEKDTRIDIRKFVKKYPYLDTKKKINLMRYDLKIKNDRYNKIKKYNVDEINTLDKAINNLAKSSDYIQQNYQENYLSKNIYLSRQEEKEKIINNNLLVDKISLIRQISKLENRINKLTEQKHNILKWIYLEIKIKEKRINLPLYYKDIIENRMNLDSIIKKYKMKENALSEKEYNNIKEYREKLIFDNIEEINEIYYNLEAKIFYDLNKKLNCVNNVKKIKSNLKIISEKSRRNEENKKKDNDKNQDINLEEREKDFKKELKKLKFKNNELNDEYSKIRHYKIMLNDKNVSFYNSNSDRRNFSKDEINMNEQEDKYSNLFKIAINLYEEEIKGNLKNIENKIKWKYSLTEEKMILDILEYTERVINFLHQERKYYNSDEKLRIKYKLVSDEIEKETKNKKLLKQLELQEGLLTAKKEKIQRRLNKKNYFTPYRKVDFQYYIREKYKNRNNKDKNEKNDDHFLQYFFY